MFKLELVDKIKEALLGDYGKAPKEATINEIHNAVAKVAMAALANNWNESREKFYNNRHAYYFSAEFLIGRAIQNNLVCMNIYDDVKEALGEIGFDINDFEEIEDMALGNGGLGRLAACFLDSAASCDIPLQGYGIRYKYGIFKQTIENGFQKELADNWTAQGDEWSLRKYEERVKVKFSDMEVLAIPYDTPIIGYETTNIGTLRLFQSEAINDFDFQLFNDCQYDKTVKEKTAAENISAVLYPNDNTYKGKVLRYRQQYFFCSAALQDLIRQYKELQGNDFKKFVSLNSIQLNDTHPVIAIPEFIRLMVDENNLSFKEAFAMARQVFNYTNHTVMSEALEKWDTKLIKLYTPEVYAVIEQINRELIKGLRSENISENEMDKYMIIADKQVHMARLACYVGKYINGVAEIHSDILVKDTLKEWYALYPDKFQNKTNGITQRRWLAVCNKELTDFLVKLAGNNSFVKELSTLKELEKFSDDPNVIKAFIDIKKQKKRHLIDYIEKHEGIRLNGDFIFDVQIKRLHEYKRQFMNALSILDIYFKLKNKEITEFTPTAFIFGAKAAPGYARAKAIIKLINEIADLINNDPEMDEKMKVVFVSNYNVSYAEKLIPGADVSEQISTAGTEASGTGNMKLMLNGAVTLGTYDGANIEIVREAGEENNYIFGAREEEIIRIKDNYNPKAIYKKDKNIKRVLNTLIDGTFDDGMDDKKGVIEGSFKELYNSLLQGTEWHQPDHYFILNDFNRYFDARMRLNQDFTNELEFGRKCFLNTVNAGFFSSDRTICQYAKEIWEM